MRPEFAREGGADRAAPPPARTARRRARAWVERKAQLRRAHRRLRALVREPASRDGQATGARRLQRPRWALTLPAHRSAIDRFNHAQPNAALLDGIREHNHRVVDDLNSIRPLGGALVLDVGASPHGYALERALEHGASLYAGIGLHVDLPTYVLGTGDTAGVLLEADATDLLFASGVFDLAFSISTLEHLSDVDAALSEIARVLKPGGRALLTFEPVWSCSYGHHLHHFGACAAVVPPWAHLTRTPDELRREIGGAWPADAPLSLDQAIDWIYSGPDINRLTIRDVRERLWRCPLALEWVVDLKETDVDTAAVADVARATGLSPDELSTKGLSLLLRKAA